tara:strand:- start:1380 stop:2336 length:957 start_codon:yes stop_codon:yes gene_type:complete
MAVYSKVSKEELNLFLKEYDIGSLKSFESILEGIENTNYKIITSKDTYILTIFEKRVKSEDLPFFIELKKHLINKKFSCPKPISNKKGYIINIINNKLCVIISFLKGTQTENITNNHCREVGKILSSLHENTSDFKYKRVNSMSYVQWEKIYLKCRKYDNKIYKYLLNDIKKELSFLEKNWPTKLPMGIIHADVFRDNVFFIENKFSGLIDFYFACYDFLSYDIALTINAWCFDLHGKFYKDKFRSIISGYENHRYLIDEEKISLSILLRGAAIRILLTRLHDKLFHQKESFVEPKDPEEYIKILNFHQNVDVKNYIK